ncbi:yor025wp-like protein [Grosmannia clavigera kw1407]|uniref:Yor025wp-like protein n=1 Tax=Grosmannia clavigera (strain kw1407 / UAMH 11150) TaxID=655863 RepID=F0XJ07_GROCL|nr:yor025wp-like protein [Grosmannia clavigera kw1407]EFX02195.1 yor025wp-like protein [Grosmannia clavigera kw1407]
MPTSHVLPESEQLLQDIADCLGKAKKVLVVTGAGISTNSGIPDFRSKNGLYSLIQAKFEAAACADSTEVESESDIPASQEPPTKRRKLRVKDEGTQEELPHGTSRRGSNKKETSLSDTVVEAGSTIHVAVPASQYSDVGTIYCAPDTSDGDQSIVVRLPNRTHRPADTLSTPACPLPNESIVRESIECIGEPACKFEDVSSHLPTSSPLSSPPPILFDPEDETFGSGVSTSSDSDSETDEATSPSHPSLSTQSSYSSRSGLPNMKGRELFDASIWADPLKTSVFYTFATTLRQKVKSVIPTPSHQFISNLRDTGKLVRCYTQNIDEIEEKVGLTTSLVLGPGKKGRFSTRTASRASTGTGTSTPQEHEAGSQTQGQSQAQAPVQIQVQGQGDTLQAPGKATANQDPRNRGVECVFLHGSLRMLRCFRCGHTTPWDENGRENETLSGRQPSCPRCEGATAAREGRGKRALAVGKLRPDIVLYGEEHPNAHLISPIVQHDISLAPDIMLILGTSLKVHGLKVLIREFSKAVHSRAGKVVFVNLTKPSESVWSDVIDYWIQWDCDAWVHDLKERKPALWLPPGSAAEDAKKKRKSSSNRRSKDESQPQEQDKTPKETDDEKAVMEPNGKEDESGKMLAKTEKRAANKDESDDANTADRLPNPDAERPLSVGDDTANGAFVVWKIMNEFARISGRPDGDLPKVKKARAGSGRRKPRHSAPVGLMGGELQIILESQAGNSMGKVGRVGQLQAEEGQEAPQRSGPLPVAASKASPDAVSAEVHTAPPAKTTSTRTTSSKVVKLKVEDYSILSAVKANPRRRQSKKLLEAQETEALRKTGRRGRPSDPEQEKKATRRRAKSMGALPGTATVESEQQQQQQPAWTETDKVAEKLWAQLAKPPGRGPASLPTANPTGGKLQGEAEAEAFAISSAAMPPLKPILGNVFFFQDPLYNSYGFPPPWPQVWSCNEQVRREADEHGRGG